MVVFDLNNDCCISNWISFQEKTFIVESKVLPKDLFEEDCNGAEICVSNF